MFSVELLVFLSTKAQKRGQMGWGTAALSYHLLKA